MNAPYDSRFASIDDLRDRARQRVPRFIVEFPDGGRNEHVNLRKNMDEIRDVESIVTINSPEVVEVLDEVGFDWLFLDGEHAPISPGHWAMATRSPNMSPGPTKRRR